MVQVLAVHLAEHQPMLPFQVEGRKSKTKERYILVSYALLLVCCSKADVAIHN